MITAKTLMLGLLFLLMFPFTSEAQTFCSNLGSTVICDGGSTTITPLGRNGGVIQTDRDVIPYTILPAPDHTRSGIQPLDRLDRLDRLDGVDTRSSGDRDERMPFDLRERDGLLLLPE